MTRILQAVFFLVLLAPGLSHAQDTLPEFSVTTRGNNKVFIGWNNNYPVVKQISIQRSFDSLRNFKTILSVPDPTIPQNGFVDTKASTNYMFYRLFIVLDSGRYLFTRSRRPFWDTSQASIAARAAAEESEKRVLMTGNVKDSSQINQAITSTVPVKAIKLFAVKRNDSLIRTLPEAAIRRFKDSIVHNTKDTLFFLQGDTILIKPYIPRVVYRPSKYVFTAMDGNVSIRLPDADKKKYRIEFFEEDGDRLFEVKDILDKSLTLDKANFLHAGWFYFKLYENGELKEEHKFYLDKDF